MLAAWKHWLPLNLTEVLGFVTGAWCVWLAAAENIWNWPIGIANSVSFGFLFLHARLYADMTLQVIYIVLGVLGWYWWLHGGRYRAETPCCTRPFQNCSLSFRRCCGLYFCDDLVSAPRP